MDPTIINTIITTVATLLGVIIGAVSQPFFSFLSSKHEEKRENKKWNREIRITEYNYKRKIYIEIQKLLRTIQIGFDMVVMQDFNNSEIRKMVNDFQEKANEYFPELMIIGSHEVYEYFSKIVQEYGPYTFPNENGRQLVEESKDYFSKLRVELSKLMKKDLEKSRIYEEE